MKTDSPQSPLRPVGTVHPTLAHRGGLGTRVSHLFPDSSLHDEIGGPSRIDALIHALYDRLETDPYLRPKFVANTFLERQKQQMFFKEWLGGEPLYSQHVVIRGLVGIHGHIHISSSDAARWLGHFEAAMEEVGVEEGTRRRVLAPLRPLAKALVNEKREAESHEHRCFRGKAEKDWIRDAERGNVDAMAALESRDVEMSGPVLLAVASHRGHLDVVNALLSRGVDPNAATMGDFGAATPLCHARRRKKEDVVEALIEHGARDDIFTDIALGNRQNVLEWLERFPDLIDATDPAEDIYHLTPLDAAVRCGQHAIAHDLLNKGARLGETSHRLLSWAADEEDLDLVEALLDAGADATRIGVGRWVLNPALSRRLVEHGANVRYEATPWRSWLWQACTGNHAKSDDPDYVRALIEHGVDVNEVHPYWKRGALHLCAKAGFAESIGVLLDHGADPNLRDAKNGETPLFHVFLAGKRVDKRRVAMRLLEGGADPSARNHQGRTVPQRSREAKTLWGELEIDGAWE